MRKIIGSVFLSFVLLMVLLSGCAPASKPTFTPTPTFTSTPTLPPSVTPSPLPTATSTPGIGVAVVGEKYEITIVSVSQENIITGFSSETWTANSGYTFLVVNVKFRSLDKTPPSVDSNQVAIIGDDKTIRTADGIDGAYDGCVHCEVTYSAGDPTTDEMEVGFVFILKVDEIHQPFRFQFQDIPLIPFRLE